jgi:hypothetical protein
MNTEYQDPTETEKELIKEMPKTRTSHFHFKNSVGLSITTCPIPDTDFYVLGVSLTHKEQGSRKKGYEESLFRCLEVFNDPRREESQKLLEESDAFAIGGKGHYLAVNQEAIKALIGYVRGIEAFFGNSKISSVYHQVFFDLPHVLMGICEWDDTPVQA